jgi:hypothetical protein
MMASAALTIFHHRCWKFLALSMPADQGVRVRPGAFFALVRELLSLAQRK